MKFIVKNENKDELETDISFDMYGNLYLTIQDKSYQINVDGKNKPYAEPGEYKILENKKVRLNKIRLNDRGITLSNKAQHNIEKNNDVVNEDREEFIFPEEQGYTVDNNSDSYGDDLIDEDNIMKYGEMNKHFDFSHINDSNNIPINNREDGDISALYDTYLYDKSRLCFKSSSKDNQSIYRIRLHNDGTFVFRPIGQREVVYKLYLLSKSGNLKILFYESE
jgi:hypothetical protein